MADDLRINGLTMSEALSLLCETHCRFARMPDYCGCLDDLCECCYLAGVIVQAYEDRLSAALSDVMQTASVYSGDSR